jgi:hypothetical protein
MARLILALLIILLPLPTQAAFSITDNFNSYSDGDLNGTNAGSGWSGAWSGNVNYDVQGTTVYEGAKGIQDAVGSNQNHTITRDFSGEISGDLYMAWRQSTVTGACPYLILREGGSSRAILRGPCVANSNLTIYDYSPGSYETVQSGLSANTWYILHVEFDGTTDRYRARVYTSSWQSFTAYQDTNITTSVTRFEIQNEGESSTSGTFFFDTIQTTDPVPPSAPTFRQGYDLINNGKRVINNGAIKISL